MDVQATPSPYASLGSTQPLAGKPPTLGQQVPGHTGGLPAQGGLSVLANPMAEELRSKGRGEDTMLVHMTPDEVNSLQGLAMASGGSLTINPHTGLPEAGWLGKLLPMIAGIGLNFLLPGSGGLVGALGGKAATAGIMTGLAGTAITGDLQKGLMAGLGAFGGASLAGGIQGALGGAAKNVATTAAPEAGKIAMTYTPELANQATQAAIQAGSAATNVAPTMVKGLGGFTQGFANTAKGTLGGMLGKAAVPAAIMGVTGNVSDAMTPTVKTAQEQTDNSYTGPYYSPKRKVVSNATTESILKGSGEQQRWFDTGMPEVFDAQGRLVQPGSNTAPGTPILQNVLAPDVVKPGFLGLGTKTVKNANKYVQQWVPWMGEQGTGYAEGGEVHLAPGSFVMPARETTEFVKGGRKGQEVLAQFGGIPIKGPGDGVSDSIPARIGGKQEARVADGEVYFPPEAVKRIGGGDQERGTKKLYALMRKAEKSRKTAPRGGKGLDLLKDLTQ